MLLVHTQKITHRLDYAFKHICTRILGVKVEFTSVIEEFIAHQGPKLSYGKQPMGNEFFVQSHGLLTEQGFDDVDISVMEWDDTIGFFPTSGKSHLPFDIFSAAFYLLSRYEEYLPQVKDELGRYTAKQSLAYKKGFLDKPVVDQWAYKFAKLLQSHYADVDLPQRNFRIHHLVDASRPFSYAQRGPLRNIGGYARDLIKFRLKKIADRTRVLLKLRKDPYNTFSWIVNVLKQTEVKFTVFFLLGDGFTFRESFNTKREKFRMLIKLIGDYTEVGLIFSFHSLDRFEELKDEKKRMEELTHREVTSTMIAKSLIALPNRYRDLLELEVQSDYSMFYEDTLGFRAGTCTPFLFYDLDYEIKTPLIVHPVIGSTCILENNSRSEIQPQIDALKDSISKVNGIFSMFLSNKDFISSRENSYWRSLVTEHSTET